MLFLLKEVSGLDDYTLDRQNSNLLVRALILIDGVITAYFRFHYICMPLFTKCYITNTPSHCQWRYIQNLPTHIFSVTGATFKIYQLIYFSVTSATFKIYQLIFFSVTGATFKIPLNSYSNFINSCHLTHPSQHCMATSDNV